MRPAARARRPVERAGSRAGRRSGRGVPGATLAGILALLVCLTARPAPVAGQGYDMAVRGQPVAAALEELVARTGISLVYSSEVVSGRTALCRAEGAPAEELLGCITSSAGLDFYRLSSGTYVIIRGPRDLPAYGTLAGEIVDGLTGEPLPGARVTLAEPAPEPDGSGSPEARPGPAGLSNSGGLFLLGRLLPGQYRLHVTRPGYAPARVAIEIPSAGTVRRSIRLQPEAVRLDPIVVSGLEDPGGPLGAGVGEAMVEALEEGGDLSRAVRTGLGVARRPVFADLSIQGGGPGEHLVRLDGVPVFDPVSLGRTRSAFSPLALRRITVRKAGFDVTHGSFAAGVIDLEHDLSARAERPDLRVMVDPYSASGELSAPVEVLGGRGSAMVAGRSSLWGVYREPALDEALRSWNQVDPVLMRRIVGDGTRFTDALDFSPHRHGSDLAFHDLHAALRLGFPGFRSVRASFYRGVNSVDTELFASGSTDATGTLDRVFLTRDRYDWSNTLGQIQADLLLGRRASVQLRGWGSRHVLDHGYGMVDGEDVGYQPGTSDVAATEAALRSFLDDRPAADDGNRVGEIGASASAEIVAGAGHLLTAGTEVARVHSETRLLNGFVRPLVSSARVWRGSAFLQDRWVIRPGLTWTAGVRATSVDGGELFWEPRTSLRLDGRHDVPGPWSLRLSAGIHHQFLNSFELSNIGPSALVPSVRLWIPSDASLAPARTRHLAAELAVRPWSEWQLRGELYHKALQRVPALDYGALFASHGGVADTVSQEAFVASADGVAYGAGFDATWERGRARAQAAYEWTVSERTFPSRFDGNRQPVPWSEPHVLSFQARLPVTAGLSLEADTRSSWGRTWALRRAYFDFLTLHGTDGGPEIGLPDQWTLPALHQVDLGASWLGRPAGRLLELRAEVRNLPVGDRVLDYSLRRTSDAEGTVVYRQLERQLPRPALAFTARVAF